MNGLITLPVDLGLRLLIVADDLLARTGLATLLTEQSDYTVAGQTNSAELIASLSVYAPNIVLWDMGWEPTAALERLADLENPGMPVVVLLPGKEYAADARLAGAQGLFLRSTRLDGVIAGLAAAARGLIVIDPALSDALFSARERTIPPLAEDLTARESQVLQFLAEGLPNKIIAQRLSISESTVKFHVNAIMTKLNAQSRTDAVVRATRLGLVVL